MSIQEYHQYFELCKQLVNAQGLPDLNRWELEERFIALETKLHEVLMPAALDSDIPLLLLPVNLETRYKQRQDGISWDLLVRVYPDDIHRHDHSPKLTAREIAWGKHFWESLWRAGNRGQFENQHINCWKQLVDQFGAERAAWIAHALQPTNSDQQPLNPTPPEEALDPLPEFPQPSRREENESQPQAESQPEAMAFGLPDRWLVRGYVKGQLIFEKLGEFIPDPLPFGNLLAQPLSGGQISLQDAFDRWMVNFEAAEQVGMGIRIENAPDRVDLLLVMGVKAAASADESTECLATILDAHHYTSGLSLVPQGTPTNNTAAVRSGFASRQSNIKSSFDIQIRTVQSQYGFGNDGDILAQALGLHQHATFSHVEQASSQDQKDAEAMNAALWPATWGYYLSQLLTSNFEPINTWMQQAIGLYPQHLVDRVNDGSLFDALRDYFISYVRARGPLPAIRVGYQPYGILPTSSFAQWQDLPRDAKDPDIVNLLLHLLNSWRQQITQVPNIERLPDPDKNVLEILSQEALSYSYIERRVYGQQLMHNLWLIQDPNRGANDPFPNDFFSDHERQTQRMLKILGIQDSNMLYPQGQPQDRLGHSSFDNKAFPINMPLILPLDKAGKEPLPDSSQLEPNYIQELSVDKPEDIATKIKGSAPLLQRLLRHATLWAYAEAAYRFEPLKPGDPNYNFNIWREPELVDIDLIPLSGSTEINPKLGTDTMTALRYLRQRSTTDSNQTIGEYLHQKSGYEDDFANPIIKNLYALRRHLTRLNELPTAKLDRLFRETLDLCSYRLDAWITSLATQRLHQMRQQKPVGIQLGGYGWIEGLKRRKDLPMSEGLIHAPSLAHAATAALLYSGYLSHNQSNNGEILALDLSSKRVRQALELLDGMRQGQSAAQRGNVGCAQSWRSSTTRNRSGAYSAYWRQPVTPADTSF